MRGFTLLEIMISISIMATVLTILYGAYASNVDAIQIVRDRGLVYQTARVVLDRMTKDMESAFIESASNWTGIRAGLLGVDQEQDGRPADTIHFTSVTHIHTEDGSPKTDLCEVGYFLQKDPETDRTILYRRDDWTPDADLDTGGRSLEMSDRVVSLDITFTDREGDEDDEWNTLSGEHENTLPTLIRISLIIKDREDKEHLFTMSVHPELAGHQ